MKRSRLYLYLTFCLPICSGATYETSAFIGFRGGALKCVTTLAMVLGFSWQRSVQGNAISTFGASNCSKEGALVVPYGDNFIATSYGRWRDCHGNSFLSSFNDNMLESSVSIKIANGTERSTPSTLSNDGRGSYVLGLDTYPSPSEIGPFVLLKGSLVSMSDTAWGLVFNRSKFASAYDATIGTNGSIVLAGQSFRWSSPTITQVMNDGEPGFTTILDFGFSGAAISIDAIPESQGGGFEVLGYIISRTLGSVHSTHNSFLQRLDNMGFAIDLPFIFGSQNRDQPEVVRVDSQGNTIYLIYMHSASLGVYGDLVVGKRTPNRTFLWEKSLAAEEIIDFYLLELDVQDSIYITGLVKDPRDATVIMALDKYGNVIHPAFALGANDTGFEHYPLDMTIVKNSYGVIVGGYYGTTGGTKALVYTFELDNFHTCYSYNISVNLTDIDTLYQWGGADAIYTQTEVYPVEVNMSSFDHYSEGLCALIESTAFPTKTPTLTPSSSPSKYPTKNPTQAPSVSSTHTPLFIQAEAETLPPKESKKESAENFYQAFTPSEQAAFVGTISGVVGLSLLVFLIYQWVKKYQFMAQLTYTSTAGSET
ncbi:MAG: hypothetical protein AAF335_03665 [Bacteroidota bacterium]